MSGEPSLLSVHRTKRQASDDSDSSDTDESELSSSDDDGSRRPPKTAMVDPSFIAELPLPLPPSAVPGSGTPQFRKVGNPYTAANEYRIITMTPTYMVVFHMVTKLIVVVVGRIETTDTGPVWTTTHKRHGPSPFTGINAILATCVGDHTCYLYEHETSAVLVIQDGTVVNTLTEPGIFGGPGDHHMGKSMFLLKLDQTGEGSPCKSSVLHDVVANDECVVARFIGVLHDGSQCTYLTAVNTATEVTMDIDIAFAILDTCQELYIMGISIDNASNLYVLTPRGIFVHRLSADKLTFLIKEIVPVPNIDAARCSYVPAIEERGPPGIPGGPPPVSVNLFDEWCRLNQPGFPPPGVLRHQGCPTLGLTSSNTTAMLGIHVNPPGTILSVIIEGGMMYRYLPRANVSGSVLSPYSWRGLFDSANPSEADAAEASLPYRTEAALAAMKERAAHDDVGTTEDNIQDLIDCMGPLMIKDTVIGAGAMATDEEDTAPSYDAESSFDISTVMVVEPATLIACTTDRFVITRNIGAMEKPVVRAVPAPKSSVDVNPMAHADKHDNTVTVAYATGVVVITSI